MAPSASQRIPVSIHALLAESDHQLVPGLLSITCFNPRPPCGERQSSSGHTTHYKPFQSTPSLRRATTSSISVLSRCLFQSTPSLRRATLPRFGFEDRGRRLFQSTPSLRRATAPTVHVVNQSCKRGFAPTSRRRYITYRLLFIILGCQSAFSNVLQESPTSRQFDVSLGLAQRPCQTALK